MDNKRGNFNNGRSTRSAWYSESHGGLVKVSDLHTGHLCNIINMLRREAVTLASAVDSQDAHRILTEGCITYPTLFAEAIKRKVWSWGTLPSNENWTVRPKVVAEDKLTYEIAVDNRREEAQNKKHIATLEAQVKYLFAEVHNLTKRMNTLNFRFENLDPMPVQFVLHPLEHTTEKPTYKTHDVRRPKKTGKK